MSYAFPKSGTFADARITPDVLKCLNNPASLPTRKEAAAYAVNFCKSSGLGATGLYKMTLLADDSVALCFYGVRGSFKVIWNFGRQAALAA